MSDWQMEAESEMWDAIVANQPTASETAWLKIRNGALTLADLSASELRAVLSDVQAEMLRQGVRA